jgi:hypothetical protein
MQARSFQRTVGMAVTKIFILGLGSDTLPTSLGRDLKLKDNSNIIVLGSTLLRIIKRITVRIIEQENT